MKLISRWQISCGFRSGSDHLVRYRLEIISGIYAGVSQDLDEGRLVVGSGPVADIMLVEPGLDPVHAAIVLRAGTVRVEGLADGVTVANVGPVPVGSARTVRLPATVDVGGVALRWDAVRRGSPEVAAARWYEPALGAARRLLARPAMPGLAAAVLLAVTVLLTLANPIARAVVLIDKPGEAVEAGASASRPGIPTSPQPVLKSATAAPAPERPPIVEAAAESLRGDIEASGLLNVHISTSGGAVSATGTIEPALAGRWEGLQKAFDERFAGDVTLVNGVSVRAEKLPASLGIEGVWRGAQPYIVVRGQRYLTGAVVDGGWTIRGIDHDRVMLERDGRLVAMRF